MTFTHAWNSMIRTLLIGRMYNFKTFHYIMAILVQMLSFRDQTQKQRMIGFRIPTSPKFIDTATSYASY